MRQLTRNGGLRRMLQNHEQKHCVERNPTRVSQQVDEAGYVYSTHKSRASHELPDELNCKTHHLLLQWTIYFRPALKRKAYISNQWLNQADDRPKTRDDLSSGKCSFASYERNETCGRCRMNGHCSQIPMRGICPVSFE